MVSIVNDSGTRLLHAAPKTQDHDSQRAPALPTQPAFPQLSSLLFWAVLSTPTKCIFTSIADFLLCKKWSQSQSMTFISPVGCRWASSLWELGSLTHSPPAEHMESGECWRALPQSLLKDCQVSSIKRKKKDHKGGQRVYEFLLLLAMSQLSMNHRVISLPSDYSKMLTAHECYLATTSFQLKAPPVKRGSTKPGSHPGSADKSCYRAWPTPALSCLSPLDTPLLLSCPPTDPLLAL